MKKEEILPQTIYKFTCETTLLEDTNKVVSQLDYKELSCNCGSVDSRLNLNRKLKKTHKWFQECIDKVRKDLTIIDNISITQSWATKTYSSEWHHPHHHPYSIISGVFYLTDSDAETWFSIPSIWSQPPVFDRFTDKNTDVIHKNKTEPGTLVLFPSSLYHSVNEHRSDDPRYTISFNTFFDKNMGIFDIYAGVKLDIK